MPAEINPPNIFDLERRILRAACSGSRAARAPGEQDRTNPRAAILAMLVEHHWQDPEHRVVFEALTSLPGRRATELREQLPAQATRMGFPDVNWDAYFVPGADDHAIEALVAELLAPAREAKP